MTTGRMSRLGTLGVAFVTALAVVVAACSGSAALTLDEYVEWCAMPRAGNDLSELGSVTWGEAIDAFESAVDEATSINPPEEVQQYHDGSIAVLQAMIAVAQQEERGEAFNPFALIGAGLLVVGIVEEATDSLSPSTRAALEEGGCLSSDDSGGAQVDRSTVAAIGDRVKVERPQSEDRFEMIVRDAPEQVNGTYRVRVTVFAIIDEWTYDDSIWTADQIELVSAPDANGRIYKLTETTSFWDRPEDSLDGVILTIGGKHDGALYFSGSDVPTGTQFVELRYPVGGVKHIVNLAK